MGWIRCIRYQKFQCEFVAWSIALIASVQPVWQRVSCSNEKNPKCTQILQNIDKCTQPLRKRTKTWVQCPMRWIACVRCQKFRCEFVSQIFVLIAPVQPISHWVSCSNETIQNALKHYKTHQFMSLASNGVDRVHSLRKTLMRFHGTNLCINCTSSTHFAPSFM